MWGVGDTQGLYQETKGIEAVKKFPTDSQGEIVGPRRLKILLEAADVTCGDRDVDYGEPLDNHQFIIDMWNPYLKHAARVRGNHTLLPVDAAILMVLVKVARSVVSPTKEDTWVDGAGYFAIAGEIALTRSERNE